jgi:hypothetical protein
MENRGLLTLAVGKKYAKQAKYLAMSCMLHIPWIIRAVITDQDSLLSGFYDIVIPYKKEDGQPFVIKTLLNKYSPFEETVYLDTDSLVTGNIDSFRRFLETHSFVYEGKKFTKGFWYFDIQKVLKELNLLWIPKFNSGMFIFKKDSVSDAVFETANNLISGGEKIAVDFFRGKMLPDEPFLAVALAMQGETPIDDGLEEYGRFSHTLIGAEDVRINTVRGLAQFKKNGKILHPLVVHFCGKFGGLFYLREKIRLFFCFNPPLYCLLEKIVSFAGKLCRQGKKLS